MNKVKPNPANVNKPNIYKAVKKYFCQYLCHYFSKTYFCPLISAKINSYLCISLIYFVCLKQLKRLLKAPRAYL